jgi:hypothetical protein
MTRSSGLQYLAMESELGAKTLLDLNFDLFMLGRYLSALLPRVRRILVVVTPTPGTTQSCVL